MLKYRNLRSFFDLWLCAVHLLLLVFLSAETAGGSSVMIKRERPTGAENPRPTPYPLQFTVEFVTNVTATCQSNPLHGRLWYDWSLRKQRIDHQAGSYECTHFYNTTSQESCSLLFDATATAAGGGGGGMYRILHKDITQEEDCCLDLPQIGPPPPDWARNGTFDGLVWDPVSQIWSYQWTFDHVTITSLEESNSLAASQFHTAQEIAFGPYQGYPLTFSFPGAANGRQDYHFLPGTMRIGPVRQYIFDLPVGCEHVLCDHGGGDGGDNNRQNDHRQLLFAQKYVEV